jgi:hypothetical protein
MSWNDALSRRPTFRLVKLRSQAAHQRRGAAHRNIAKLPELLGPLSLIKLFN